MFDVTQSMNVQDEQLGGKPIARLQFAKHALREALLALPCGSKIGMSIFTEHRSFLLFAPVEVCANLGELRSTLERIDGRMAWIGNSEVAKGLYSGIGIARQLPGTPSLVFITDGQEAPPLSPRHRPPFDGKRGEVKGLIVGVGDLKPSPIPKTDPLGRPLGFWDRDEVLQVDPRSLGRGASVGGERMVEEGEPPALRCPARRPAANISRRCARPICSSSPTRPGSATSGCATARASSPRSPRRRWRDRSLRGPICASCRPASRCCCCSRAMAPPAPAGGRVCADGGSASPRARGVRSRYNPPRRHTQDRDSLRSFLVPPCTPGSARFELPG